jgi:hypothetical protein
MMTKARTNSEFRSQIPITSSSSTTKSTLMAASITTANLSVFSPAVPPPRSTTSSQLSTDDISASPDDDDELERRSKSKVISPIILSSSLSSMPLSSPVKRLCLWQNHIRQTNDDDPQQTTNNSKSSTISRLNNLNLSHNRFETFPPMLSCLVPYLTTLNLSHNMLTDASCIASYPARLKTLDLSSNRLEHSLLAEYCPEKSRRKNQRHSDGQTKASVCFRPEHREHHSQIDANKRRRSRSVSRHKVLASTELTLNMNSLNTGDTIDPLCTHRRHVKLEFLHDLNLGQNQISQFILTVRNTTCAINHCSNIISSILFCRRNHRT